MATATDAVFELVKLTLGFDPNQRGVSTATSERLDKLDHTSRSILHKTSEKLADARTRLIPTPVKAADFDKAESLKETAAFDHALAVRKKYAELRSALGKGWSRDEDGIRAELTALIPGQRNPYVDRATLLSRFSHLKLSDMGITELDGALRGFTKLDELNVSHNKISEANMDVLPRGLKALHALGNHIADVQIKQPLDNLLLLGLGHNRISALPPLMHMMLPRLHVLDLSANDIVDPAQVLAAASKLRQLTHLLLYGCPCAMEINYVPRVMAALPALQSLDDRLITDDARAALLQIADELGIGSSPSSTSGRADASAGVKIEVQIGSVEGLPTPGSVYSHLGLPGTWAIPNVAGRQSVAAPPPEQYQYHITLSLPGCSDLPQSRVVQRPSSAPAASGHGAIDRSGQANNANFPGADGHLSPLSSASSSNSSSNSLGFGTNLVASLQSASAQQQLRQGQRQQRQDLISDGLLSTSSMTTYGGKEALAAALAPPPPPQPAATVAPVTGPAGKGTKTPAASRPGSAAGGSKDAAAAAQAAAAAAAAALLAASALAVPDESFSSLDWSHETSVIHISSSSVLLRDAIKFTPLEVDVWESALVPAHNGAAAASATEEVQSAAQTMAPTSASEQPPARCIARGHASIADLLKPSDLASVDLRLSVALKCRALTGPVEAALDRVSAGITAARALVEAEEAAAARAAAAAAEAAAQQAQAAAAAPAGTPQDRKSSARGAKAATSGATPAAAAAAVPPAPSSASDPVIQSLLKLGDMDERAKAKIARDVCGQASASFAGSIALLLMHTATSDAQR